MTSETIIRYPLSAWNTYARVHASITTSPQRLLFAEACSYLSGNLIDCGCGSAKLVPLLINNKRITHYTGVDYAEAMVLVAKERLSQFNNPHYFIKKQSIEDVNDTFTAAVSIHSYYTWPNPIATLEHIFKLLTSDALFVLATPNNTLNQEKMLSLLDAAEKELGNHADFELFKACNLQLVANLQANFISMKQLVKQVEQVGFKVIMSHQKHYAGGVNFLVLKKH